MRRASLGGPGNHPYYILTSLFKGQIKYKVQLTNDTFSTLISICDIFNKISNGQIQLNRFGTNPIEHDFGTIRMRSNDHHKAERFIQEASKINSIRKLREDMIMESIKHRDLQFGRIVNRSFVRIDFKLIDDLTISLINEASTKICDQKCHQAHLFFQKIIEKNNKLNKKCYLFNSDEVLLAPNANIMIEKRQNSCIGMC